MVYLDASSCYNCGCNCLSCCNIWWAALSISSCVISSASCISREVYRTKSESQYLPRPCSASTRPTKLSADPTTSKAGFRSAGLPGSEWLNLSVPACPFGSPTGAETEQHVSGSWTAEHYFSKFYFYFY